MCSTNIDSNHQTYLQWAHTQPCCTNSGIVLSATCTLVMQRFQGLDLQLLLSFSIRYGWVHEIYNWGEKLWSGTKEGLIPCRIHFSLQWYPVKVCHLTNTFSQPCCCIPLAPPQQGNVFFELSNKHSGANWTPNFALCFCAHKRALIPKKKVLCSIQSW